MTDVPSAVQGRERIVDDVMARVDSIVRSVCSGSERRPPTSLRSITSSLLSTLRRGGRWSSADLEPLTRFGISLTSGSLRVEELDTKARELARRLNSEFARTAAQHGITPATVDQLSDLTADLFEIAEEGRRALTMGTTAETQTSRWEVVGPAPYTLVLVLPNPAMSAKESQDSVLAILGPGFAGPVADFPVAHAVLVVPNPGLNRSQRLRLVEIAGRTGTKLLVGGQSASSSSVEAEYEQALQLLPTLGNLLDDLSVLHEEEQRLVRLILSVPIEERIAFVRQVLGPVLRDRRSGRKLWSTLGALWRQTSGDNVPSMLGIQRKTIFSRLRRIKHLTQLDPQIPIERSVQLLAWFVHRVDGLAGPGESDWRRP